MNTAIDKVRESETKGIKTRCCELLVTVEFDKEGLITRVSAIAKNGGCRANLTAVCQLLTDMSKYDIEQLEGSVKHLKNVSCNSCVHRNGDKREDCDNISCASGIAHIISSYFKKEVK